MIALIRESHRLVIAVLAAAAIGCGRAAEEPADLDTLLAPASLDTEDSVQDNSDENEGWSRAVEPREWSFPRDHAAHDDYRIEWWYYTGNLQSAGGRRFGYQLTFFRTGLNKEVENPSRWAVRDLYTAHFAVSDLTGKRHRFAQRNRRAGVGQAGADSERLHAWNGDWLVELEPDSQGRAGHRLRAEANGVAIDLLAVPPGPPVLHGDGGLSQKGAAEGNASYYYSYPRLPTTGTVTVEGKVYEVTGDSWMDHEFSTSFLERGQLGWDWFSLQLSDGSQLMLYQMRREDGTVDPYSSGTLISPTGEQTPLAAANYTLKPIGKPWRSPQTDAEYPLRWRIEAPGIGLSLTVAAAFEAQEMVTERTTGIAYWEGSVSAEGESRGSPITGVGYLELTGYSGAGLGSLLD